MHQIDTEILSYRMQRGRKGEDNGMGN